MNSEERLKEYIKYIDVISNQATFEYTQNYKNKMFNYIDNQLNKDIEEILNQNQQLKEQLNHYTLEYGTKVNMQELSKKQLIDMLVASFSREHKLTHNWDKLEEHINELLKAPFGCDVNYCRLVLDKMQEIGGKDE